MIVVRYFRSISNVEMKMHVNLKNERVDSILTAAQINSIYALMDENITENINESVKQSICQNISFSVK
jgi:hypothetical protein